jgi:hypothetical protein
MSNEWWCYGSKHINAAVKNDGERCRICGNERCGDFTREEAIAIACRCAKEKPQTYFVEPFKPHEWVIDAIMEAANMAEKNG